MAKFLLDNDLTWRAVASLADIGINTTHVKDINMNMSPDNEIIEYAKENDYIIVTADSDFCQLLFIKNLDISIVHIRIHKITEKTLTQILKDVASEVNFDSHCIVSVSTRGIRVRENG